MASTLKVRAGASHYRAPSRIAVSAARALGMRPGSVEQLVHGHYQIHVRLAAIIEAAAALGDTGFIERVLAPIDAARAALPTPALTAQLIQQQQQSDAVEEIAESRFLSDPTAAHRREWLHALERQRADSLLLVLALRQAEDA